MKRFHPLLAVLLLLFGGIGAWSLRVSLNTRRAAAIVRRALVAENQISYTGIKISRFWWGKNLVESQALVARRPPDMKRIHYITPPRLAGVTIWQSHQETYRFNPRDRQLSIYDKSRHLPGAAAEDKALVLQNYQ